MRRSQFELSEAFAAAVRRHRESRKVSKQGLAERAGLHQTYVGLLERGLRSPNIDTADKLARALGLKLSELIRECEGR